MRITKRVIKLIDNIIYKYITKSKDTMPIRIGKFIALFYTDARVRKQYSSFIGAELGEGTFANLGMKVIPKDSGICVHIGKNVSIGPNVTFVCLSSANNCIELNRFEYVKNKLTKKGDIYVEDEVWIGANTTILPNVRIGTCSVVGAGSVVIDDVLPYSIYVGTPAVRIRDIRTGERIR